MTVPSLFGDSDDYEGPAAIPTEAIETSRSGAVSASSSSLYRKYRPHSFDSDESSVKSTSFVHCRTPSGSIGSLMHTSLAALAAPGKLRRPGCSPKRSTAYTRTRPTPLQRLPELPGHQRRRVARYHRDRRGQQPRHRRHPDLRERVRYAPAQLRSKVYIIDESHQITGAAANAFLKTLEEPPAHTRFILATTDPEELLPTIVSRCQRFDFRRVSADDIVRRLQTVAALEGVSVDADALRLIARHATGSLRDALGLLEQLALGSAISSENSSSAVDHRRRRTAALGLSRNDRVEGLVAALGAGRRCSPGRGPGAVDDGEDPRQLNRQLLAYLRVLLIERSGGTGDADGTCS